MPIHQPVSHLNRATSHIEWLIDKFPNVEAITVDLSLSGINQEIIDAVPSDGLWEGDLSDEDQIGASYDELEWAMTMFENLGTCQSMWEEVNLGLNHREKEVIEIYKRFNTKNKHKMVPIPVYDRNSL